MVSLAPLRERNFRVLWSSRTLSAIGDSITPVALALAVVEVTGSAVALGLVLASTLVARLGFLVVGGVWADRLPRRAVMITADVVRCVVQLLIALMLFTDEFRLPWLMALAAIGGAASAFFQPASMSVLQVAVSAPRRQQANALMGLADNGARILGPALAGVLVASVGAGWALALDGVSFGLSALFLSGLRVRHVPLPKQSFWNDLRSGMSELKQHEWYWKNLISHACWHLAMGAYFTLGPLVAVQQLGGASAWAIVATVGAVGALGGGVLSLRVRPRRPLVHANVAAALSALPLLALAAPMALPPIAVAAAVAMAGLAYLSTLWETAMQTHIPQAAMSRVVSWDIVISLVVAPLGYALAGPLSERIGTGPTFVAAAILLAGTSLAVLAMPSVRRLSAGRTDGASDLTVLEKATA